MENLQALKDRVSRLNYLVFVLTERCNNNCIHCNINRSANDSEAKKAELSTDEIKAFIKEAADYGFLRLRFTGGEPLLREDFEELYIFAKKLGFRINIYTNATLIDSKMAELFKKMPPGDKIEITAYGISEQSYEACSRKKGSFEAFMRGLENLKSQGIPFSLRWVCLPTNAHEYDDFPAWAKQYSKEEKRNSVQLFDLRVNSNFEKNKEIAKLRMDAKTNLAISLQEAGRDGFSDTKRFCRNFLGCHGDRIFACATHVSGGAIDSYGIFSVCMMLGHLACVYDLKKGSLREALEEFAPRMPSLRALNPDYLARCAKCFLKSLCQQCPVKSWLEHRTLDTPIDYYCRYTHEWGREIGLLRDGEKAWELHDWKRRLDDFLSDSGEEHEREGGIGGCL